MKTSAHLTRVEATSGSKKLIIEIPVLNALKEAISNRDKREIDNIISGVGQLPGNGIKDDLLYYKVLDLVDTWNSKSRRHISNEDWEEIAQTAKNIEKVI